MEIESRKSKLFETKPFYFHSLAKLKFLIANGAKLPKKLGEYDALHRILLFVICLFVFHDYAKFSQLADIFS